VSEERRPRSRRTPGPKRPRGFDDVPQLSDEEVEQRIGVREGVVPRRQLESPPPFARRPPGRRQRKGRTVGSDSILILGLLVVGLVALRFLLPASGPLSVSATSTPDGSAVAIGSAPGGTPAPGKSGVVVTLGPVVDPSLDLTSTPTPVVTAGPSAPAGPTTPPIPTPTLRPGQTPHPTGTPKPTLKPSFTPGPTPPNRATIHVVMSVINNSGGSALPSAWTMKLTGEAQSGASPQTFSSGATVTIPSGLGYLITDNGNVAGYGAPQPSTDCHRDAASAGLAPGASVTCTITRNDIAPHVNVTIAIVGADPPDAAVLAVTGSANASPSSISGTGTTVTLDANADFAVVYDSGASGYAIDSSGTCSSSGLALAQAVSCTYTFTEPTPTVPGAIIPPFLPFLLLPRRWRTTRTR